MFGGHNGMQPQIGPQMPPHLDPASNNQPLQFNNNKNKPPMPIVIHDAEDQGVIPQMSQSPEENQQMIGMHQNMGQMMMPGPGMGQMPGPWGPINGMMGPNMMGVDPNMMMYSQYGYMGPMPPMDGPVIKEIITLKSCVLYPPPPNAPPPSTRERPPGCRTIFVGGLPELMTEDFLHEIFDNCGPITSIRMSKKNFAHIRFEMESCVDRCIYLSGYRVKIEDKDEKPNVGRIHVDYAQARDDLFEWECQQRSFAREERHRIRMEEAKLRPPSPPPVIHFSEHEASLLLDKLKSDDTFPEATHVLITWLERGDCSRRNANVFYSLVQSTNAHIRRLLGEQQMINQEFENIKMQFHMRRENLVRQFEQIETVFTATSKQKSWDHFSKAQRKNLDMWRKQAKDIVVAQRDAFLRERQEADMEMSDTEEMEPSAPKKKKSTDPTEYAQQAMLEWQTNQLKEENDSLKCQLEAYKNEVDLLKLDSHNADDSKDKQLKALQVALQGMQHQLIQAKQQMKKDEELVSSLKTEMAKTRQEDSERPQEYIVVSTLIEESQEDQDAVNAAKNDENDSNQTADSTLIFTSVAQSSPLVSHSSALVSFSQPTVSHTSSISSPLISHSSLGSHSTLPNKEARILAVLSTFLHVHPFGASLDYIWSYLDRLSVKVRTSELEDLLERYPTLYKLTIYGIGASIEKRWKFIGFEGASS